jgi:hypothetical protein
MIFPSSPYYPLVKRLRRLLGDEENPAAAFTLAATGSTAVTAQVSYTAPSGMTPAAQSLIISGGTSPVTLDLTQFASIRELLLSLNGLVVGQSTLAAQFIVNPLRTNSPLDLVPGIRVINASPQKFYTRHYLADEDLQDDLDGALTQFGPNYTFNPNLATQQITTETGATAYPYPDTSAYPYPGLASTTIYLCPTNIGYFICYLAAAFGLMVIANRYSRLPVINTEDAIIDRSYVVRQLKEQADSFNTAYNTAMEQAGLTVQVGDLTRISSRLNILSQTPELDPDIANNVYGLRWLSTSIPNLVQPVTQDNAHAYDTALGSYFETPAIGPGYS